MKKVKVIFPDGSTAEIEESQVSGAISAGAKRFTDNSPEAAQKSTSMVFADGSIADVPENAVDGAIKAGAKKKVGSEATTTPVELNGSLTKSVPTTSALPLSANTEITTAFDLSTSKTPTITTNDGTAFPINQVVANNFIQTKNTPFDIQALQNRVASKTTTDEDVAVLAKSSGKSIDATKAYIHGGNLMGGSVENIENVNNTKLKLTNYINDYNTIYGTKYDPNDVLSSSQKVSDFLDVAKNKKIVSETTGTPNQAVASSTRLEKNFADVPALLPTDISNEMIQQVVSKTVDEDKVAGIPKDQTVIKIAKRLNPKEFAKVSDIQSQPTLGTGLNPATAIGNLFRDNTNVNELLNTQKGYAELAYNQALKQNSINKISEGVLSGNTQMVNDGQHDLLQVDDNVIDKYPALQKQEMIRRINETIAQESGVVVGSETQDLTGIREKIFGATAFDRARIMKQLGYLDNPKTKDTAYSLLQNPDLFADNSIIGGAVSSSAQPFKDLGLSIADISGIRNSKDIYSDKIRDELFPKDFSQNTGDEPQLKAGIRIPRTIVNTTANLAGMLAISTVTEGVAGGLGASASMGQKLGAYASFGLNGYDRSLKDAPDIGIENPIAQHIYATINAIANAEGGRLLDLGKVTRIPGVSEDFATIAKGLSENSITEDATRSLLAEAKNKYVDFAVKYGKNVTKGAATMAYFTTANNIIKLGFGDSNTTELSTIQQAGHAFLDGVLGMSILGGFGAVADMKNEKNTTYKGTIYNMALNHDAAKDVFDIGLKNGEYDQETYDNKVAILNTAVAAKDFLNIQEAEAGVNLNQDQKAVYVGNKTAENLLRSKANDATLPETKAKYEKQADQLKIQSNQILEGLDFTPNLEPLQDQFEAGKEYDAALENYNPDVPETVTALETAKTKLDATVDVKPENIVPDITVSETMDKPVTYKGEKGMLSQEGQTVIFKVDGKDTVHELGNVEELKNTPIADLGIAHENSVVGFDGAGNIKVRDESYINQFSDPLKAINRDKEGNVVSVNLETTNGKKRTFRGNVAEDVAYQIHLKEITKDNETRSKFEDFINNDTAAQSEINNAGISEVPTKVANTSNAPIPTETTSDATTNTVDSFVNRISSGEKLTTPEDLQFYENNKTEIESGLKNKLDGANQQANTENKQGDIKTETPKPAETKPTETTQPTETLTVKEQAAVDAIKGREFKGGISNWTDVLKDENSTVEQKKQALKELKEQLLDPESEGATGSALGQKASDAIYDMKDDINGSNTVALQNEPPNKPNVNNQSANQEGIGISKEAVFERFGKWFEKTKIGWNEITKNALNRLREDAERKNMTIDQEASFQVRKMADEISNNRLSVSEDRITTATLHLINTEENIDNLQKQKANTPEERAALAIALDTALGERDLTLHVIDALGSKSGRNLGLFAGFFSKNDDGGITITRRRIEGALGMEVPETEKDLDANDKMSPWQKERVRPYVKRMEAIKTDYEKAIADLKEKKTSAKSSENSQKERTKASKGIRDFANKIRSSETLDKLGLGKARGGEGVKISGFTFNVKEHLADALDFIADAVDKGADIAKAIADAAAKFKGKNDEKEFKNLIDLAVGKLPPLEQSFIIGDANTPQTFDVKADAIAEATELQRRKTLGQLNQLSHQVEDSNRKWYSKALDWRRSFLIGGIKTVGRVAISGVSKFIVDPIVKQTTGRVTSLLPGLKAESVSAKNAAEGIGSLIRFKDNKAALDFISSKQKELEGASEKLDNADAKLESLATKYGKSSNEYQKYRLEDYRKIQQDYQKAELENAKAAIYKWINGNGFKDAKDLIKYGSTDFEQAMGGYGKIDTNIMSKGEKYLYYIESINRSHAVLKSPSARRALVETYNSKLENYQKEGIPLTTSTRMRALDMAYGEFLSGKYQEKTQLVDFVNKQKSAGEKEKATTVEKAVSTFLRVALPVAKVGVNIVKSGVDMSTVGVEGIVKYMYEVNKGVKLNAEQGKEYKNVFDKLSQAAENIPEKEKVYINKVLSRGLFGLALMLGAGYGVSNGTIQYGGEFDPDHKAKRKFKDKDGNWKTLDYGEWVIGGQSMGKFGSSVLNHLPEFLPVAMVVNTHDVYAYEHDYKGVSGRKKLKDSGDSYYEALKSDVNEISERLPYKNLLEPAQLARSLVSIQLFKDISEYFDKDKSGNLIERKPSGIIQTVEMNTGLRKLVDLKSKK